MIEPAYCTKAVITSDAKVGNSDNQNNRVEDTPTGLIIVKDAEANIPDSDNTAIEDTNYRADITQHDNEIIITIRKPVYTKSSAQPETLMPTPKLEEEPVKEIELEMPPEELQNAEDLNKIIPDEISIKEVIHTVVKGDTLWAIAKNYVNDPFLYPELARLSNIKNPHRIYPGNRVRILCYRELTLFESNQVTK
jgi:nucleoid-associated protein YgaU